MMGLFSHLRRDMVEHGGRIGLGDPMVAPPRVIALPTDAGQRQRLLEISRSRTEPTSRVERARIILAYLEDPSACAVARTIGVRQQNVTSCMERGHELGTTRLLAAHARQHGPSAGHPSLGKLAQGTVCKILAEQEVKPHKKPAL